MAMSGVEILIVWFFLLGRNEMPQDALALVAPDVGLTILGEETARENLERLISGKPGEAPKTAAGGKVSREAESAIENLASQSEKLRARAREQLVEEGVAVIERLREVAKNDERRSEEAKKTIALIEGAVKAAGQEKSLARLFAIRYAAAEKITALVPALEKAAASDDPFVKAAAEDALARVDESYEPPESSGEKRRTFDLAEIAAFPAETRLIQILDLPESSPGKYSGVTIQSFFRGMQEAMAGALGPDAAEVDAQTHRMSEQLIGFVKSYGNIRPEGACAVNVGGIDDQGAGLAILARGIYEPHALESTLRRSPLWTSTEVAGRTVYASPFLRLVLLSERSVLLLPIMASARFPLEDYLKSLEAEEEPLEKNERLARFLRTVGDGTLVRALAITDETLMSELHDDMTRGAPQAFGDGLRAMDEIEGTLILTPAGKSLVRLEAAFEDEKSADGLVTFVRNAVDQGIAELEREVENVPPFPFFQKMMENMLAAMRSIKVSAEGKKGIFRMEIPDVGEVFLGMFGVRAEAIAR